MWHDDDRGDRRRAWSTGTRPGSRRSTSRATSPSSTRCRDRFPDLRIWSGVETGEPHLFAASVADHLRDAPVDRVLGSLHSLVRRRPAGRRRPPAVVATPTGRCAATSAELVRHDREQRRLPGAGALRLPPAVLAGRHAQVRREGLRGGVPRGVPRARLRPAARWRSTPAARWPRSTRCAGSTRRAARRSASAATPTSRAASAQQFDLAVDVVEAAGFRPGTRPLRLLAPLTRLSRTVLHR